MFSPVFLRGIMSLFMKEVIWEKYDRVKSLRGGNLFKFLAGIFTLFLVLGLLAGYLFAVLSKPLEEPVIDSGTGNAPVIQEISYEGTVTYIDPQFHPYKDISYELTDFDGKTVVLLKADDEKLLVSEGHYVKVFGKISKTDDGEKDVLLVERVVIKNVPN